MGQDIRTAQDALEAAAQAMAEDQGVPVDGYFMSMRDRHASERAALIRALASRIAPPSEDVARLQDALDDEVEAHAETQEAMRAFMDDLAAARAEVDQLRQAVEGIARTKSPLSKKIRARSALDAAEARERQTVEAAPPNHVSAAAVLLDWVSSIDQDHPDMELALNLVEALGNTEGCVDTFCAGLSAIRARGKP